MTADDPLAIADRIATRAAGRRPLIALDHDGTLSAIAPRPEDATLIDGAHGAIERLSAVADVVIVSGRGLADLEARFAGLPVALVSEHGVRHRHRDGSLEQFTDGVPAHTLVALRNRLHELLAGKQGWLIEEKDVSLAVHHRLVPDELLEPTLTAVRTLFGAAATPSGAADGPGPGGHVQIGKAVTEIRPSGADKGVALRRLVGAEDPGDRGVRPRPVVMVGDDLTDEAALEAAEQMGGVGVLVAHGPRRTAASARLESPGQVVELLEALTDSLTRPFDGRRDGGTAGGLKQAR